MRGKVLVLVLVICVAITFISLQPSHAQAIDDQLRNLTFDLYPDAPPGDLNPAVTAQLDSQTFFILPPSPVPQAVRMIQRFWRGDSFGGDQLFVGIQRYGETAIDNSAATLIYQQIDGRFQVVAALPMREWFNRFRLVYSNEIGDQLLILRGVSGMHFHEVWVYKLGGAVPELIAANGSAAGVHIKNGEEGDAPQIWVGVADWSVPGWNYATGERRWMVYTWRNGAYSYNSTLSTVEERSITERALDFANFILKDVE